MTATRTVWYRYVTFGPCELPDACLTPTQDRDSIIAARAEALAEMSCNGGPRSWTEAHSWLHGYATREQAECGDCSYGIGTHGRVE